MRYSLVFAAMEAYAVVPERHHDEEREEVIRHFQEARFPTKEAARRALDDFLAYFRKTKAHAGDG